MATSKAGNPVPFIKRVVGVAGDLVQIHEPVRLTVNGVKLDEPYVPHRRLGKADESPALPTWIQRLRASHVCDLSQSELSCRVPAGDLFVLGATPLATNRPTRARLRADLEVHGHRARLAALLADVGLWLGSAAQYPGGNPSPAPAPRLPRPPHCGSRVPVVAPQPPRLRALSARTRPAETANSALQGGGIQTASAEFVGLGRFRAAASRSDRAEP